MKNENTDKYVIWGIVVIAVLCIVITSFFMESGVDKEINQKSCEELKEGYINHKMCKNLVGQEECRGNLLFEYLDRCLEMD